MQKLGGAVILMNRNDVTILAGSETINRMAMQPFSGEVILFLDELSKRIRKNKEASLYPDVMTFGFFCRRANIESQKSKYDNLANRLGRGVVFHIAPSNVPINFAYSYVFGLLAGNSNVVRVSSKQFPQVYLLGDIMNEIFEDNKHQMIKEHTLIVEYARKKEITDWYSSICQSRVIWGGDQTIEEIRKSPLPPRSVELTFADRYSIGVISPEYILSLTEEELNRLANGFYNDTYLMDQNACSSPHLILWKKETAMSKDEFLKAKERFWQQVFEATKKYELADIKVSEKYSMLCEMTTSMKNIELVKRYENLLYVITLKSLMEAESKAKSKDDIRYRGKFGLFFETEIDSWEDLAPLIDEKVQTLAVAGIAPSKMQEIVLNNQWCGIDRIVPFGKTLDISLTWDGYDIISMLSRVVAIQ